MIHRINRFEIELSLKLGVPISQLRKTITKREYDLYLEFYMDHGFGEAAEYVRSANQIITIINYITGALGGKPPKLTPEDIYPQLSSEPNNKRPGNNVVDWSTLPDRHKKSFIELGMFTEDGEPIPQNPHK